MRALGGIGLFLMLAVPAVAVDYLVPPEIARAESVAVNDGVKLVHVGNAKGHYSLSCNLKAPGCVTPIPGEDYYLFDKNTHWKIPGAKQGIDLSFVQEWTSKYNGAENIALVSKGDNLRGDPSNLGMYILDSWTSAAHK